MSLGPWQIVLIVVVLILLFGAGKIPRLASDMAKGIKAFKKGMKEDDETPKSIEGKSEDTPVSRDTEDSGKTRTG